MSLGNIAIREAIKSGDIILEPFDDANVAEASYDYTLGEHFYRIENRQTALDTISESAIAETFTLGEKVANNNLKQYTKTPEKYPNGAILLGPRERILAHTHEYIGIKNIGAKDLARSTIGRLGIAVCYDAGWIDPGFLNRITL